jgi:broad specificity phosphatase PhoE
MLIAIRHGHTTLNEDGSERLRGWLPVPLTLEGMKASRETAESLSALEDVYSLYTSDLVRAVQAAEEVAQVLSIELEPREELRDWNYGDLSGKLVDNATINALHDYMEHPNKVPKNGSSFQEFLDRTIPFLTELVESEEICIAVTHNRVLTLLNALCKTKGDYPHMDTLKKKGPIDPSGIMIVNRDWKIEFKTKLDTDVD